jgi:hypothetical protein
MGAADAAIAAAGKEQKMTFPKTPNGDGDNAVDHFLTNVFFDAVKAKSSRGNERAFKGTLSKMMQALSEVVEHGSVILPAAKYLLETIRISNRVVSFVLDQTTHLGTGVLIGNSYVLTAAHLFFGEDGRLIDLRRLRRISVAIDTTLLGDVTAKVARRFADLSDFADPGVIDGVAQRDVRDLDYAIIEIDAEPGTDNVGAGEQRHWFTVPGAATAPILIAGSPLRIFQYIDTQELRVATGVLGHFTRYEERIEHRASTVSGASGAPLVNDEGQLLAIHVSGALSGVFPKANYALPIGRIAEQLDTLDPFGNTIRGALSG